MVGAHKIHARTHKMWVAFKSQNKGDISKQEGKYSVAWPSCLLAAQQPWLLPVFLLQKHKSSFFRHSSFQSYLSFSFLLYSQPLLLQTSASVISSLFSFFLYIYFIQLYWVWFKRIKELDPSWVIFLPRLRYGPSKRMF